MKKLIMTAAVVACASIVSAQVVSDNIVGYTKINVVGGELALAALNLDAGPSSLTTLIPDGSLPNGSSVYLWDKVAGTYLVSTMNRAKWNNNFAVDPGDAMWIAPAGTAVNTVVFAGEVITADVSIALPAGIVATGYYFPVAKDFKTTQMAADLPNGSALFMWDGSTYAVWTKSRGAWAGTGTPIMNPADGFWVDNGGAALNVTEPVPFTP